jgi:hypothetical protein
VLRLKPKNIGGVSSFSTLKKKHAYSLRKEQLAACQECLRIRERFYGPRHELTAMAYASLALAHEEMGTPAAAAEAVEMVEKAAKILKKLGNHERLQQVMPIHINAHAHLRRFKTGRLSVAPGLLPPTSREEDKAHLETTWPKSFPRDASVPVQMFQSTQIPRIIGIDNDSVFETTSGRLDLATFVAIACDEFQKLKQAAKVGSFSG